MADEIKKGKLVIKKIDWVHGSPSVSAPIDAGLHGSDDDRRSGDEARRAATYRVDVYMDKKYADAEIASLGAQRAASIVSRRCRRAGSCRRIGDCGEDRQGQGAARRDREGEVMTPRLRSLATMMLLMCAATARAQGVGPNVVLPATRPRTNLQIMGTMQVPWSVSIHPATNYVAIGQCLPVYIDLLDASGKDIPRNPTGNRVSIADFDWTATGNAAIGKYDGPNAWAVCACPAAAVGSTIHVDGDVSRAIIAGAGEGAGARVSVVH